MEIIFKRIVAFLIDVMFVALLSIVLGFVFSDNYRQYPAYIGFVVILIRDLMTPSGSIGKKILKLRLVNQNKNEPNIGQKILRNITVFLWPIEGIVLLIAKKRIGDMIVRTDVITSNK